MVFKKLFGRREPAPDIAQLEANRDVIGLFKAYSYGGKGDFVSPAMNALVRIGKVTIEPLIRALEDQDEEIRDYATTILWLAKNKKACEPLAALLSTETSARVRSGAAQALFNLDWTPDKGEHGLQYRIIRKEYDECVAYGARAVAPLIAACANQTDESRAATRALVKIGKPAVDPLIAALKHKDERIRLAAAEALGLIGDPRAINPLLQALKKDPSTVAEALGRLKSPLAVEALIPFLNKDQGRWTRLMTAQALGNIGDTRAVEPLIQACGDEWANVRFMAAEALGKLKDRRAHAVLTTMTEEEPNPSVRRTAFEALKEIYQ